MSAKIVVVGSLNTDLVAYASRIPVAGETISGHSFLSVCGGKGANQAYAAARLGAQVEMIGKVGADDFGKQMRANLESVGCATSGVETVCDSSSGIALIFVADSGQNSIVVVPGANGLVSAQDIESGNGAFRGAAAILLQLEIPLAAVEAAAKAGRATGVRVILDPAPAPAAALPRSLLRDVDVLTPNETEAAILVGLPPGRMDAKQAFDIARRLQALGPRTVIVKLGDQGCVLRDGNEENLIAAPKVRAIDTTAAGDVFNAALAVALGEGFGMADACRFANRAAAISVTRRGAQPAAPDRAELNAFAV